MSSLPPKQPCSAGRSKPTSLRSRRSGRSKLTSLRSRRAALLIFVLLGLVMIYGFCLSPYGVNELTEGGKLQPPSWAHPMGTDHLARDLLTRVGQGAGWSLLLALGIIAVGASLGLVIGGPAAYFGGPVDWALSRLTDTLLAFPGILMALMLMTVLGRGVASLVFSLGLAFVPSFARIARAGLQKVRGENYIKRLEIMDAPAGRIIFVHMLPLIRDQYLNALMLGLANALLAESGLSFLGFGLQPPTPSWGSILAESHAYIFQAPWYAIFPGFALVLTVFAIYLFGRSWQGEEA